MPQPKVGDWITMKGLTQDDRFEIVEVKEYVRSAGRQVTYRGTSGSKIVLRKMELGELKEK